MTGSAPEARDPMNRPPAIRAVENELTELPLEVGFHAEKLEAQHLGADGDLMGAVQTGSDRLVNEFIGPRRLLGYGMDGALEDVALTPSHDASVGP